MGFLRKGIGFIIILISMIIAYLNVKLLWVGSWLTDNEAYHKELLAEAQEFEELLKRKGK